ncbi:MAG TPA: VCBS repeat-containing protein [Steroidobacteraceae bacterium]|nr:VCBS repeat-containing protein [Steroidobacteraceae bacterium]
MPAINFALWARLIGLAALACVTAARAAESAPAHAGAGCTPQRYPHFDRVLLLETSSETSANVSIGDVSGAGHPDVLLAKGRHWPLVSRVLLNDGHGRFPVAYDLGAQPYRSYSAVLADLTGHGFLDVVLSNDAPDPKIVYLNDGKGHFRPGSTFGRPEWPTRNVAVADLNGDGLPDIIVANRYGDHPGGANYVCLNRGDGKFDADCIAFSHESATTITAADFSGRGHVDLAVPNRDGGQSYVYLNDGQARFPQRRPFGPRDAHIRVAAAANLTGSGHMDLVTIDDERPGTFIYFNQPDGTFSAPLVLGTVKATPYALAVGDLNRDGKVDIVVGYLGAPAIVYFNEGNGRSFAPVPFGDSQGSAYGIAIADLDGDGWPDIAVARSGAPNVVYFSSGAPPCSSGP